MAFWKHHISVGGFDEYGNKSGDLNSARYSIFKRGVSTLKSKIG